MNSDEAIGIIELGNVNLKCVIFKIINDNAKILSTSTTPSYGFHNDTVINLSKACMLPSKLSNEIDPIKSAK